MKPREKDKGAGGGGEKEREALPVVAKVPDGYLPENGVRTAPPLARSDPGGRNLLSPVGPTGASGGGNAAAAAGATVASAGGIALLNLNQASGAAIISGQYNASTMHSLAKEALVVGTKAGIAAVLAGRPPTVAPLPKQPNVKIDPQSVREGYLISLFESVPKKRYVCLSRDHTIRVYTRKPSAKYDIQPSLRFSVLGGAFRDEPYSATKRHHSFSIWPPYPVQKQVSFCFAADDKHNYKIWSLALRAHTKRSLHSAISALRFSRESCFMYDLTSFGARYQRSAMDGIYWHYNPDGDGDDAFFTISTPNLGTGAGNGAPISKRTALSRFYSHSTTARVDLKLSNFPALHRYVAPVLLAPPPQRQQTTNSAATGGISEDLRRQLMALQKISAMEQASRAAKPKKVTVRVDEDGVHVAIQPAVTVSNDPGISGSGSATAASAAAPPPPQNALPPASAPAAASALMSSAVVNDILGFGGAPPASTSGSAASTAASTAGDSSGGVSGSAPPPAATSAFPLGPVSVPAQTNRWAEKRMSTKGVLVAGKGVAGLVTPTRQPNRIPNRYGVYVSPAIAEQRLRAAQEQARLQQRDANIEFRIQKRQSSYYTTENENPTAGLLPLPIAGHHSRGHSRMQSSDLFDLPHLAALQSMSGGITPSEGAVGGGGGGASSTNSPPNGALRPISEKAIGPGGGATTTLSASVGKPKHLRGDSDAVITPPSAAVLAAVRDFGPKPPAPPIDVLSSSPLAATIPTPTSASTPTVSTVAGSGGGIIPPLALNGPTSLAVAIGAVAPATPSPPAGPVLRPSRDNGPSRPAPTPPASGAAAKPATGAELTRVRSQLEHLPLSVLANEPAESRRFDSLKIETLDTADPVTPKPGADASRARVSSNIYAPPATAASGTVASTVRTSTSAVTPPAVVSVATVVNLSATTTAATTATAAAAAPASTRASVAATSKEDVLTPLPIVFSSRNSPPSSAPSSATPSPSSSFSVASGVPIAPVAPPLVLPSGGSLSVPASARSSPAGSPNGSLRRPIKPVHKLSHLFGSTAGNIQTISTDYAADRARIADGPASLLFGNPSLSIEEKIQWFRREAAKAAAIEAAAALRDANANAATSGLMSDDDEPTAAAGVPVAAAASAVPVPEKKPSISRWEKRIEQFTENRRRTLAMSGSGGTLPVATTPVTIPNPTAGARPFRGRSMEMATPPTPTAGSAASTSASSAASTSTSGSGSGSGSGSSSGSSNPPKFEVRPIVVDGKRMPSGAASPAASSASSSDGSGGRETTGFAAGFAFPPAGAGASSAGAPSPRKPATAPAATTPRNAAPATPATAAGRRRAPTLTEDDLMDEDIMVLMGKPIVKPATPTAGATTVPTPTAAAAAAAATQSATASAAAAAAAEQQKRAQLAQQQQAALKERRDAEEREQERAILKMGIIGTPLLRAPTTGRRSSGNIRQVISVPVTRAATNKPPSPVLAGTTPATPSSVPPPLASSASDVLPASATTTPPNGAVTSPTNAMSPGRTPLDLQTPAPGQPTPTRKKRNMKAVSIAVQRAITAVSDDDDDDGAGGGLGDSPQDGDGDGTGTETDGEDMNGDDDVFYEASELSPTAVVDARHHSLAQVRPAESSPAPSADPRYSTAQIRPVHASQPSIAESVIARSSMSTTGGGLHNRNRSVVPIVPAGSNGLGSDDDDDGGDEKFEDAGSGDDNSDVEINDERIGGGLPDFIGGGAPAAAKGKGAGASNGPEPIPVAVEPRSDPTIRTRDTSLSVSLFAKPAEPEPAAATAAGAKTEVGGSGAGRASAIETGRRRPKGHCDDCGVISVVFCLTCHLSLCSSCEVQFHPQGTTAGTHARIPVRLSTPSMSFTPMQIAQLSAVRASVAAGNGGANMQPVVDADTFFIAGAASGRGRTSTAGAAAAAMTASRLSTASGVPNANAITPLTLGVLTEDDVASVSLGTACEECTVRTAAVRCQKCVVNLCAVCDTQLHGPAQRSAMRQHTRIALPPPQQSALGGTATTTSSPPLSSAPTSATTVAAVTTSSATAAIPIAAAKPAATLARAGSMVSPSKPPATTTTTAAAVAASPSAASGKVAPFARANTSSNLMAATSTSAPTTSFVPQPSTAAATSTPATVRENATLPPTAATGTAAAAAAPTPITAEVMDDPLLEVAISTRHRARAGHVVLPTLLEPAKCEECGKPATLRCGTCRVSLCAEDDLRCHPPGTTAARHGRTPVPTVAEAMNANANGNGNSGSLLLRMKSTPPPTAVTGTAAAATASATAASPAKPATAPAIVTTPTAATAATRPVATSITAVSSPTAASKPATTPLTPTAAAAPAASTPVASKPATTGSAPAAASPSKPAIVGTVTSSIADTIHRLSMPPPPTRPVPLPPGATPAPAATTPKAATTPTGASSTTTTAAAAAPAQSGLSKLIAASPFLKANGSATPTKPAGK